MGSGRSDGTPRRPDGRDSRPDPDSFADWAPAGGDDWMRSGPGHAGYGAARPVPPPQRPDGPRPRPADPPRTDAPRHPNDPRAGYGAPPGAAPSGRDPGAVYGGNRDRVPPRDPGAGYGGNRDHAPAAGGRDHGGNRAPGRRDPGAVHGGNRPPGVYGGGDGQASSGAASVGTLTPPATDARYSDDRDRGARTGGAGKTSGKNKRPARKKSKARSPLWTKLLITFGALIVLASGGGIALVKYSLHQIDTSVASEDLLGDSVPANVVTGTSIKGPINILLVGVDTRPTGNIGSHSDSMIIMHIPASHDHAYLISIPRDTSATIPANPKTGFYGGSYKINASFTFGSQNGGGEAGGFALLAKTIQQTWGITFNGGAIVNFDGFKDIVTKLGGVDMYVDETTYSIHHGVDANGKAAPPYKIDPNTGVPICYDHRYYFDSNPDKCTLPGIKEVVYKKGQQHLSAYAALDFVRCRDGLVGTDYARQRHQQQFMKAVLKEVYQKGLSDPLKMQGFIQSIGKAITFDRHGVSLSNWIWTLKSINPDGLVTIKTNNGDYVHYTGPAPDSRQALNATSEELFNLIKADKTDTDDKLQQFLVEHPDWVANS